MIMEDSESTKYVIHARLKANGVVERPDVVGAIFGQTEGLVGKDLDLRDLQKSGKVGRINVKVNSKGGRSKGDIHIPTSLGKLEASILAASLETIERVGPCKAKIEVTNIEDVRSSKREQIASRAQELVSEHFESSVQSSDITQVIEGSPKDEVKKYYGLTAGPNVQDSDAILVVEGRSDVLNLLQNGVKNAIAVGGTDMPGQFTELSRKKTVTAFLDGDRGGDLILKELKQRADIDHVARAPDGKQVEHLDKGEITSALKDKVSADKAKVGKKRNAKKEKKEQEEEKAPGEEEGKKEQKKKKKKKKKAPEKEDGKKVKRIQSGPKKPLKSTFLKNAKKRINQKLESSDEGAEASAEESEAEEAPVEESPEPAATGGLEGHFDELKGSSKARLIDRDGNTLKEVATGELMDTLRGAENGVSSTVLDGIITQRLLDVAAEKGVQNLVGAEMGEVVHRPADLEVRILDSE